MEVKKTSEVSKDGSKIIDINIKDKSSKPITYVDSDNVKPFLVVEDEGPLVRNYDEIYKR